MNRRITGLTAALVLAAGTASAAVVTFDAGTEGWQGPQGIGGVSFIDTADGQPAPSYRTIFNDFGITFYNETNPDWIGDYTATPAVEFSVDVRCRLSDFFGIPAPREFIVELRNSTLAQGSPYPWVSVYYSLGIIHTGLEWTTWGVTIADTSSAGLPAGWGGYGDEDPQTFEPRLPPGVTFSDVLAGVDTIALTTLVPGYFFGFTDFDVSIDNITINRVPAPGTGAVLAMAGLGLARRRR